MSLKISIDFELCCDSCGKKSHGVCYDGQVKSFLSEVFDRQKNF